MANIIVCALLWAACGYQLRRLRHGVDNTSAVRALALALGALAAAFTVITHEIGVRILDRPTGLENLHYLAGHALALTSSFGFQSLLLWLGDGDEKAVVRRIRLRAWLLAVAVAVMAIIFTAYPEVRHELSQVNALDAARHFLLWYMAVFLFYGVASLLDIMRGTLAFARTTPDRWMRRGMRWMAAGAALGCGYAGYKAAMVASAAYDGPGPKLLVISLLTYSSAAALTIGCLLPPLGRRSAKAWRARRVATDQQALMPLWSLVTSLNPGVVLDQSAMPADAQALFSDPAFRLARLKTEIADSLEQLGDYFDPKVARDAARRRWRHGLLHPAPATVDAAVIAAAVTARRAGHPAPATPARLARESDGLSWMLSISKKIGAAG